MIKLTERLNSVKNKIRICLSTCADNNVKENLLFECDMELQKIINTLKEIF